MANLTDADKVLRNDTGKDIVTQLTAIKTAIENGGGGGDYANKNIAVTFDTETAYNENDYVIYSGNLYRAKNDVSAGTWTGATDWESVTVGEQLNLKAFTVVCTQAQYNTWNSTTPKSFPVKNAYYVITDAQNLNATASDIEYSGGVTVKDQLDTLTTKTAYKTYSINNIDVYRAGNVVFFNIITGTNSTDANGLIVSGGSNVIIKNGYRPVNNVNVLDTVSGNRMTCNADGTVWTGVVSQSGQTFRLSGCWITTDAMPT